jgi:hypothetical protein
MYNVYDSRKRWILTLLSRWKKNTERIEYSIEMKGKWDRRSLLTSLEAMSDTAFNISLYIQRDYTAHYCVTGTEIQLKYRDDCASQSWERSSRRKRRRRRWSLGLNLSPSALKHSKRLTDHYTCILAENEDASVTHSSTWLFMQEISFEIIVCRDERKCQPEWQWWPLSFVSQVRLSCPQEWKKRLHFQLEWRYQCARVSIKKIEQFTSRTKPPFSCHKSRDNRKLFFKHKKCLHRF